MDRLVRIALCLTVAVAGTGLARAADADASKCVPPSFTYDVAAALKSCTALLDDETLSQAERARILTLRGRSLKINHQLEDAICDFDAALALRPGDIDILLMRGWAAVDQHDFHKADNIVEQVLAVDPNNADAYVVSGVAAHFKGDYAAAIKSYDKAVALNPNDVLARFNRLIFYKLRGYPRGVVTEANAILTLKTPDLDTRYNTLQGKRMTFRTQARLERALIWETMGQTEQAEKAFADWIAIEPGAVSYGYRGGFYERREHHEQALADLDKALGYDPNFWRLHHTQGRVFLYSKRNEEAVGAFTRAIALNPDSGNSYWLRAMAERRLDRNDAALRDALKAVAIDPATRADKIATLTKLGYFEIGPNDIKNPLPALAEAVKACMVDERCW